MPMIDVYGAVGTFADKHTLAAELARTLMTIEQVPDIPMFRKNTAAFVNELPNDSISNVDGDSTYVRVHVLTNVAGIGRSGMLPATSPRRRATATAGSGRRAASPPALAGPCRLRPAGPGTRSATRPDGPRHGRR